MSLWSCDKCGWQGRKTQQSGHKAFRCPKQGALRRNLEKQAKPQKPWQVLKCLCGCGEDIPQVKGQKKRHFVTREHYERFRAPTRTAQAQREAEAMNAEQAAEEERSRSLAEELAPIVSREAETRRTAEQVPMVTGEASFALWAKCLGFNAGDVTPVAA